MAAVSRRRPLWLINGLIVLVVLLAASGTVYALTAGSSDPAAGLRTTPVGRGTVAETVTASGAVTSATSSTLNFAASGRIDEVRVELGEQVEQGEVVATLDAEYADATLDAARAQRDAARRQLRDAREARDDPPAPAAAPAPAAQPAPAASAAPAQPAPAPTTAAPPSAGGAAAGSAGAAGAAGSGGAATSPEAAVAQAEASLAQAEASVVQAEQDEDDLELESPQDGTVVSLDATEGQIVSPQGIVTSSTASGNPGGGTLPDGSAAAGGGATGAAAAAGAGASAAGAGAAPSGSATTGSAGAPAVMTVLDLSALQIRSEVPELDVGRLAVGQPVSVTVNALPDRTISGTVSTVDLLPGSGSAVQYGTSVTLTGPPPGLRPGMSASIAVTVRAAPDVAFLPSVAIDPVGGAGATAGTVRVLGPDGTPQERTIGLGLASDTLTEVRSGLAPGELVVLPDPDIGNVFAPGEPPPRLEGGG